MADFDDGTFYRVKDKSTGHEYDMAGQTLNGRLGRAVDLVKSDEYPPTNAPRPPKHNVTKDGKPRARATGTENG